MIRFRLLKEVFTTILRRLLATKVFGNLTFSHFEIPITLDSVGRCSFAGIVIV